MGLFGALAISPEIRFSNAAFSKLMILFNQTFIGANRDCPHKGYFVEFKNSKFGEV